MRLVIAAGATHRTKENQPWIPTKTSDDIDLPRRRFFGTAALTLAAAQFGMIGSADAETKPAPLRTVKPGTNTSFGPLKQVDAGLLNVGYAEAGPANGPAVLLLHGWPYDIYSYVDVAPLLESAGYHVIVPYLRGYDLSTDTFRNGQPSAVALDIIARMDALTIQKATIGGFDWGHERPTSSRRFGRNAARRWSR